MGVAVLNPQYCLKDPSFSRQPLISPLKSMPQPRNPNRAARAQPNRRKRSPPRSNNPFPPPRSAPPQKNLSVCPVRILKRGENLAAAAPALEVEVRKTETRKESDLGLLGRAPEFAPSGLGESNSQVALFYAGSAFFTSPPPSSVPLPAFFTKKSGGLVSTDDATSGLRRLLRLD